MRKSRRIEGSAQGGAARLVKLPGIHIDDIEAMLFGVAAEGIERRGRVGCDINPVEIEGVAVLLEKV
jgi:hypothetical protein